MTIRANARFVICTLFLWAMMVISMNITIMLNINISMQQANMVINTLPIRKVEESIIAQCGVKEIKLMIIPVTVRFAECT